MMHNLINNILGNCVCPKKMATTDKANQMICFVMEDLHKDFLPRTTKTNL